MVFCNRLFYWTLFYSLVYGVLVRFCLLWYAINEANTELSNVVQGVNISRDSHYQLSNRIAFSWKIASMGLPVVLIYLGFIGDHGIKDAGEPFKGHDHWEGIFETYCRNLLPEGFIAKRINCGLADFQMIVRSRAIMEPSPPKD